jgi:short-subunit dehydrogenase
MEKWILVTGASTGIGRATAEYIAQNGFHVYAGARKKQDLDGLAQIPNIIPLQLDVTKQSDIELALSEIKKRGTGLYGVVNNAGIAVAGPLMDIPVEEIEENFNVNVFGIHRVTKACFPLLLESKGRIVMMSSDSGFFATPFFGPYCSTKFAVEGYADSLRRELLLYDVKVVLVQPGRITTPIWDKGEHLMQKFQGSIFAKEAKGIGDYAIRKGKTAGMNPVEVGKVVYQALTVPKPKLRYLVANNKMKYRMVKILPATTVDNMIRKELAALKKESA